MPTRVIVTPTVEGAAVLIAYEADPSVRMFEVHVGERPGFELTNATLRFGFTTERDLGKWDHARVGIPGLVPGNTSYVVVALTQGHGSPARSDDIEVVPCAGPGGPGSECGAFLKPTLRYVRKQLLINWTPQEGAAEHVIHLSLHPAEPLEAVAIILPGERPEYRSHEFRPPGYAMAVIEARSENGSSTFSGIAFERLGNSAPHVTWEIVGIPPPEATRPWKVPWGQPILFDATATTDPEEDPLNFTWEWGDGNVTRGAARAEHTYALPGTYRVLASAIDPDGISGRKIGWVEVAGPRVEFYTGTVDADTVWLRADEPLIVHANWTELPEGLSYAWSWGDGTWTKGVAYAEHTYTAKRLHARLDLHVEGLADRPLATYTIGRDAARPEGLVDDLYEREAAAVAAGPVGLVGLMAAALVLRRR